MKRQGKVLVVDDEPLVRDTIKLGLERDFEVVKASSGSEALARVKETEIPVVILDLRMEGMDGISTLQHLRKINPSQKVIILTAHQSMETAIKAVNFGAFNYLTKPCDLNSLRGIVLRAARLYLEERARIEEFRERLMSMHDEAFSVLCHEFNTPLNAIIGFSAMLAEESASAEHRELAGYIERSGKQLHRIFGEVMDYIGSDRPGAVAPAVFTIRELERWIGSDEIEGKVALFFGGNEEDAEQPISGPKRTLKTILTKIFRVGDRGEEDPQMILWFRGESGNRRLHLQIQGLDFFDMVAETGSTEEIFSPYAASRRSLTHENRGLGLHMATCRNLAVSSGIDLTCRQTKEGRMCVEMVVPVDRYSDQSG